MDISLILLGLGAITLNISDRLRDEGRKFKSLLYLLIGSVIVARGIQFLWMAL